MTKFILSLVITLVPLTYSFAQGETPRERKVKVALALSGKPTPPPATNTVAPFPREVIPQPKLPYFDGYAKASLDSMPLVIFIGCDRDYKTETAILSKVDNFGTYKSKTILVGFPQGDRLFIDKELNSSVTDAELEKAIKAAGKKMTENPVRQMPAAPTPLNWQIQAQPLTQPGTTCSLLTRR